MSPRLGTAFVPVSDPPAAARWYAAALDLRPLEVGSAAATLAAAGDALLTLLGPESGIATEPGLPWATCGWVVEDLAAKHAELGAAGTSPSVIEGDASVCLFFTVRDLDGNVVLITDR